MSDANEPPPVEPTSMLGVPLPDELTRADPGLLVDSVRGSVGPKRDASDARGRHTTCG